MGNKTFKANIKTQKRGRKKIKQTLKHKKTEIERRNTKNMKQKNR
jgi:hypothetical protein